MRCRGKEVVEALAKAGLPLEVVVEALGPCMKRSTIKQYYLKAVKARQVEPWSSS